MALFSRRRGLLDGDPLVGRRTSGRLLLSPPSLGLFVASLVLAGVALLIRYTAVDVPIVNSAYVFELLLIGYVVLLVGVLIGRRY